MAARWRDPCGLRAPLESLGAPICLPLATNSKKNLPRQVTSRLPAQTTLFLDRAPGGREKSRHQFVTVEVQHYAYLNRPIPIGFDKTISQPLIVAVMTDLLELKPDDIVLEIGTGLGYQSAVLAELAGKVYSVEIIDELAERAVQRLKREGYTNIAVRVGNGYYGPSTRRSTR